MNRILIAVLLAVPSLAAAQAGPSWLRNRTLANALNPKISAIGDFTGTAGPSRQTSRFALREVELGFQSDVDPYARYDLFVAKPDGEPVEIEEGYVTLNSLPGRFALRAGKFKAGYGRLNMVHGHELPQIDRPLVLDAFLGEEGLRDVGVELSRIFAPLGFFTELSYGVLNGLGEAEAEPTTATVLDANGNPVNVQVDTSADPAPGHKFGDYGHVARGRAYGDITDTANIELGVSGAIHQPKEAEHRSLVGIDATFRWKPVQEGQYRSFLARAEYHLTRRQLTAVVDNTGAVTTAPSRTERRGGYLYGEYQPLRRWKFGLRGDYAENPTVVGPRAVTRAVSPYVGFTLSEFNRFRFQLQRRWLPTRRADNYAQFQWVIVLGPHGAHQF